MKCASAAFSVVLSFLLCGPLLLYCAETARVDLPSWLTAGDASYLSGGIVKADVEANATLEGFASGKLQQSLEDEVGNYIPAKATALLTTAALQRSSITTSNLLFNWHCYPTFYGSTLLDVPSEDRLVEMAEEATSEIEALAQEVAGAVDSFSGRHPDTRVLVYLAPDSQNTEGSPSAALMSNPLTYDQLEAVFESEDGHFEWVSGGVTYDEFRSGWYRTDHHWNEEGSYQAYTRIASAMGFGDSLTVPSVKTAYDEPPFYGTFARRGLSDGYSDAVAYYEIEAEPKLSVEIRGEEVGREGLIHKDLYNQQAWNANKYANRYAELFHDDYGLITIRNQDAPEGRGGLLMVVDSYSNSMERLLAAHFSVTYVFDPRHSSQTLDEFLLEHAEINDVLFLMREPNLLYETTLGALAPMDSE